VCLLLGTLSRQFDLATVIAAARALEAQNPGRFEWIIGGDGPTATGLKASAADLPNVHFPGWLDGPELTALLEVASIGLAPYAAGATMSLPNKPFEYAWAGLPVVSSLGGELEALLASHGFGRSYRADDAGALAGHVSAYHADPVLRQRDGAAGHRLWEAEYDAAATYERMADYLEQVAQPPRDQPQHLTPTGIAL
jgi:glycosyltransferase involved in cell wall biosynthesis